MTRNTQGMTSVMPVVVLISGSGSNLQALIDGQNDGSLPIAIRAVFSNRADAFGLERARQAGIATEVISHKDFPSREDYDAAMMQAIDRHAPQLVVLAGFMRILTDDFVRRYSGRMLNIHPSLLPKFRGLNTHQRAIDAGETQHGVSVHFVSEELDAGAAILQAAVDITSDDNAQTLAAKVQQQEHVIYPRVVKWFAQGRLKMASPGFELDGRNYLQPFLLGQDCPT